MANSVVIPPNGSNGLVGGGPMTLEIPQLAGYSIVAQFADAADQIPPWGSYPGARDRALRAFWPNEPFFASALYNTIAKYASFGWSLEGGPRTVKVIHELLHQSEHGKGWVALVTKVLNDLYTQDNGAFIEVVRSNRSPTAPAVELNHLDSARCVRTGLFDAPVIYYDAKGSGHRLLRHQVIDLAEYPSPDESMRGVQYCALTRCLRAAQIMREVQIFKKEKVSGRFTKRIHLVGGIPTRMIDDAIRHAESTSDAQGLLRYMQPVIIGSLDPTSKVSAETLDLATLPDGYDQETDMKWYVTQLALAFGSDYQDFAPVSGTGSSTGNQSQISNSKARGKGPALFMRMLEHALNFHGVMPTTVTFRFGEQDTGAELERILLMKEYALALQITIESGTITPQVARQMMADRGFLPQEYLALMRDPDPTPNIIQISSDHPEDPIPTPPGDPAPKEPPGTAQPSPATGAPPTPNHANNNARTTRAQSQRPPVPA